MHYYVADPSLKQQHRTNKLIGGLFLLAFFSLIGWVWVPYALAAFNATAITILPPDWAQSYIAATLPQSAKAAGVNKLTISTDNLHIEAPIVESRDSNALLSGVVHDPDSAKPGQPGRIVISGHRFWPGSTSPWATVFFSLDRLKVGDTITLQYDGEMYSYKVFESWDVPKDQAKPKLEATDKAILTIYTCGPTAYSAKHRLGFNAVLDESKQRSEAPATVETLHEGLFN